MKCHFVGIKGTGMSALAIIYKNLGNEVSGSDYNKYIFTQEELIKNEIPIYDFNSNNVSNKDLIVVGHNFINSDNIELIEAKNKGIRILEYNEALNVIIKNYFSIAVSGSNGKSTTTGLIVSVLNQVEKTSYLIGSGEGKGSKSKYFTFEACEYKDHFLTYAPNLILVNNIDYDHVDYFKSEEQYVKTFYNFINQAKNIVVVNGDDKYLKNVNNVITFGIGNNCLIRAQNISYIDGITFDLYCKNNFIDNIKLKMYGKYMLYNVLACISVCMSIGIDLSIIKKGLENFNGVKRRFKETIINGDVYIDDYAHHPSKINAIIDAVKQKYKDREVIAFFRPDRITRLEHFSLPFLESLKKANEFYVLPFITSSKEEIDCYNNFITINNLKFISEEDYSRVSRKKNVVYLMMSSKDISEVKEKILKYKG